MSLHVAGIWNGGAEIMAALLLGGADINEPFIQPWHVGIKFQAGRVSAVGVDAWSNLFWCIIQFGKEMLPFDIGMFVFICPFTKHFNIQQTSNRFPQSLSISLQNLLPRLLQRFWTWREAVSHIPYRIWPTAPRWFVLCLWSPLTARLFWSQPELIQLSQIRMAPWKYLECKPQTGCWWVSFATIC